MIFLKKNWSKAVLLVYVFVVPIITFADGGGKLVNPLGDKGPNSIQEFIMTLLQGVLKIGIPIIALAIIYSGFLFVAARVIRKN